MPVGHFTFDVLMTVEYFVLQICIHSCSLRFNVVSGIPCGVLALTHSH